MLVLLLFVMVMTTLSACGGNSAADEPDKATMQKDVQEYITQVVDEKAEIVYFSVDDTDSKDSSYMTDSIVTYQNETTKYVDMFELKYSLKNDGWELDKISVVTDYEGRSETTLEGASDESGDKDEDSKEDKNSKSQNVTMSDELRNFTFTLDGDVYQLPFAYSELTANGWTISDTGTFETEQIAANSYTSTTMAKAGNKIYVDLINLSGNAKALSDCKVGGIDVYMNGLSDAGFFTIAKGITAVSSKEDITAAFGSPNTTNDYDDYTNLRYEFGYQMDASFSCYKTDTKYNEISLRNYASDESDVTETSTEVPDYLAAYKAPAELGTDPLTGNIDLAGKVYTLPAPVSEFTAAGWSITSKPDAVGSGRTENIRIEKDDMQLYVDVKNFSEYQTIPENCAIYRIYVYDTDAIPLTLPGGISFASQKADVEAWKTDEFAYDKGTTDYSYSYDDYNIDFSLRVAVNVETEKIDSISLSVGQWPE